MDDLDPKLKAFTDRAAAEIPVPDLRLRGAVRRAHPRRAAGALAAGLVGVLLLGSGVAIGAGVLGDVFRTGNVSAVGSRAVTLEAARAAGLPLPSERVLPGGWAIDQVQLTMTEDWRSVELQYRRPGARGLSVGVWSAGITVKPTTDRTELINVAGIPVEIGQGRDQITARFAHRGATVVMRAFSDELTPADLRSLATAWLAQAQ